MLTNTALLLGLLGSTAQGAEWRGLDLAQQEEMVSERRVALVIGNAGYAQGPLDNPGRDATAMAERLQELGFDTELGIDLDHRSMIAAIRRFGKRLNKGGTGLFYFAGHGLQVDGENFMIPIGAEIDDEDHVESESVAVSMVLGRMEGAENRLNILVLDACRNNPYESKWRSVGGAGLTAVDPPRGTLIAFATAPGTLASDGEGEHGLYTQALLDHLGADTRDLEDTFKAVRAQVSDVTDGGQVPQEYTSVTGDFFFSIPEDDLGSEGSVEVVERPTEVEPVADPDIDADDAPATVADSKPARTRRVTDRGRLEGSWGFGTFSPFMHIFVEGPLAPAVGTQGVDLFFTPALALAGDPDHGGNLTDGSNIKVSLMGGFRIYNRFPLGGDATGFKVSAIATAPIFFPEDDDPSRFLPGFGGGVSIDAHVGDVLFVEVGGAIVVDNHPWFLPNLSFGAAF